MMMLAASGKEGFQQLRSARIADAAANFRRVVACALREKSRPMLNGAAFRIGRAEIKPADARKGNRRGAHGTRFERHIEIAIDEPLAAEFGASLTDGE